MEKIIQKVLALKYRPVNFSQLIGQSILVETITNSIKLNKLPNAYLLSGIRGVGKTTTARLIAKALNCSKDFFKEENCDCNHCKEITNSKHLDVLEINGSDKTGIDDVRELIESSKYNPTSAKYKVIILDEVQQLSRAAFNGLLKILEEPPPHLKFIFATTEVRKIPVTIISRCQRFDLHRVQVKELLENLKRISKIENGKISEGALKLIAKASEGSVRDSLSLLDRALISQHIANTEIDEKFIRKMLGVADKSKVLELISLVFKGDKKKSIELLREMVNQGIDATSFLNDLLEIIYFIQQRKNFGDLDIDLSISETEIKTIDLISKDTTTSTLILFWQFILKTLDELSIVSNPILSIEMLIIRLVHLKDMPSYESILNLANKNIINSEYSENISENDEIKSIKSTNSDESEISKISKNQIKNTTQTKPQLSSLNIETQEKGIDYEKISSFEDLIELSSRKKEAELKYDLEKNVNLIKFSYGKIDISFNENLAKDFVKKLSEKLLEWTGKRWLITLTKAQGQKTFAELKSIKKQKTLEEEKDSEVYNKFKKIFKDSELIKVIKED